MLEKPNRNESKVTNVPPLCKAMGLAANAQPMDALIFFKI